MSRYWSKLHCLKGGWVTLNENFWGKGASPTNEFWPKKTRVPELSYGEKIAENFNRLSGTHQRHRQTDRRQTTDGIATAISEREREFTSAKNRGEYSALTNATVYTEYITKSIVPQNRAAQTAVPVT